MSRAAEPSDVLPAPVAGRLTGGGDTGRTLLPPGSRVRGDIQGLRALAVLGVVVYHADNSWLPGGFVGVDVFFVISGFVITSQLLRTRQGERIRLRDFYANRIRRLLPMSFTVLVATLLAAALWLPPLVRPGIIRDARATALYVSNMLFASKSTDYWSDSTPSLFQHYWSLAVEEQFYLVWPVVLTGLLLAARRWSWALAAGLALLTAGSFATCVLMTSWRQPWAFFTLPPRAWELGVGALIAVSAARLPTAVVASRVLGWLGLLTIGLSMCLISEDVAFPGAVAAVPVVATALVITAGTVDRSSSAGRALSPAPLRYIGDISYSLYLWHWPVLMIPRVMGSTDVLETVGLVAVCFVLAAVSYRVVEQPFRRSPRLSGVIRPLAFAATTLVVTLAATVPLSHLGRLATDRDAPALTLAMLGARNLPATDYVPRNLRPSLREAANDVPATVRDGCHLELEQVDLPTGCEYRYGDNLKVALFGDSHALQWFPAVAREAERHGWTLLDLTKASCPSSVVTVYNPVLARSYTECDEWRAGAFERLEQFEPDVVMTGSWTRFYASTTDESFESEWRQGGARMFGALPAHAKVVVLGDTPMWPRAPKVCLSGSLGDASRCARPRSELVDDDLQSLDRSIASAGGARFVDTSSLLCREACPAILGDVLVYRDYHHLTTVMAETAGPRLSAEAGLPIE